MAQGILVLKPAQLLHRLRNGEATALDEVVQTLGPKLFNFIYRMTGDRHAAEDLAQEVFVKLLRQAPKMKDDDNLSAWLFTVGRNLTLNHLRGRRTASRHVPTAPEAGSPEDQAEKKEQVGRIQKAIEQLEEPIRSTFILCAIQGVEYEAASRILDCPKKTVNTRMFRAWDKLRKILKP